MPFLRLARDHRGYETTILLHAAHPGAKPRVLYWYRSAPGVRIGRPALDEDAIRTIEEHHPEIEFDWPHILEVRAAALVDVERRPERPLRGRSGDGERRKSTRPRPEAPPAAVAPAASPAPAAEVDASAEPTPIDTSLASAIESSIEPPIDPRLDAAEDEMPPPPAHAPDLLSELVGRDIATRLRARYAEINARIHQLPADDAKRAMWEGRAKRLNPDTWLTPHEILRGVSHVDELFDALRRELLS